MPGPPRPARRSVPEFPGYLLVSADRLFEVVEDAQLSAVQHRAHVAELADLRGRVRNDDERSRGPLGLEDRFGPPAQLGVGYRERLVDQVALEIDRHGYGEAQLRAHPGRVRRRGHVEIIPELGKLLDEALDLAR